MGGAPARVDGRLGAARGAAFPPDFDQDRIPVFNTNTALIALDALDASRSTSTWLYVEKSGRRRAGGAARAALPRARRAELDDDVPRGAARGPRGRFLPIKEPEDLGRAQPALRTMLAASVLE